MQELIGNATKISKYLVEHKKTYIATLKLGEKTDTGDSEGTLIERDLKINEVEINKVKEVLQSFIGKQMQIPPIYSAIKVNGKLILVTYLGKSKLWDIHLFKRKTQRLSIEGQLQIREQR